MPAHPVPDGHVHRGTSVGRSAPFVGALPGHRVIENEVGRSGVRWAAVAFTVVNAYGERVDAVQGVMCARCGGPVVVADESAHPCGVHVQHGQCADCGVRLWRLLDERRVPVTDARGRWATAPGRARYTVRRLSRPVDRVIRPGSRPARRSDRTRPGN
jgi:hypothetical protein